MGERNRIIGGLKTTGQGTEFYWYALKAMKARGVRLEDAAELRGHRVCNPCKQIAGDWPAVDMG